MNPDPDPNEHAMVTKAEGAGARLTVKLSIAPKTGVQSLKERYNTIKYDLGAGYSYPDSLKSIVPTNVPEYIDQGENYVEKVTRALFYFKQCALIGPSGVGKSVCEGEPALVMLDGRPILTTVDDLYEKLSRRYPTSLDQDGWETLPLTKANVSVLSYDPVQGDVVWKRSYAMARSRYKGNVVEVTTSRNRSVRATPEHSFVTESETVKAGQLAVGAFVPIVRHIPSAATVPLESISVADYVPGAKAINAGLVFSGRSETFQVPAPPTVELNEEFSWFLGFFIAEGSIGNGFASVSNSSQALIWRCTKALSNLGLVPWTRKDRGLLELRVSSKVFVSFLSSLTLSRRVGTGKGSQARYKKIPDFVFSMSEPSRVAFLSGFFEGDGWTEQGSMLVLGTSSKELANGLVVLLEQLGIFPTVRIKTSSRSYSVAVARNDAARLTSEIRAVPDGGSNRGHVEKVRITPAMLATAKRAYRRLPAQVRTKKLNKRLFSNFYGSRMIGLATLERVAKELGSPELLRMAQAGVLWDPIKEVKQQPYDGWVYDFQVPGTETFSAGFGGVITHNTHIVYLVAKMAGLPLWEINCGLQTSVYDLFGRFVGLGKENWIDGLIVSWCRYGGILYLDEANMMKQDIATRLNPILDTRGHMVLTEKDNEIIPRHPQGYVIISMNPYSAEFAGTKPLNAAFRRRMSVWVDFDYLSVGPKISQQEVKMTAERTNIPVPIAERMVRVAADMRKRYKNGDLPYAPSVGDLVNWATLVADGLTPVNAAEETIVSVTSDDPEVQGTVRRVVQMVFGTGQDRPV